MQKAAVRDIRPVRGGGPTVHQARWLEKSMRCNSGFICELLILYFSIISTVFSEIVII